MNHISKSSRLSKRTIRILVLGKDGSGKSTLINNLLEEELAYENHGLDSIISKDGIMEEHIKKIGDSRAEVVMYDTTAIDRFKKGLIYDIQEMGGVEVFDAVLFCFSSLHRVDSETESLVTLLHDSFGRKLWDKTVFVLTFVNIFLTLHSIRTHMADSAKYEAVLQLARHLKDTLVAKTSVGNSTRCFSKVPVVLAGCEEETDGFTDFPMDKWQTNVWKACINSFKVNPRYNVLKVVRVKSIENGDQYKSVPRGILVGAATGAAVGTVLSPVMGTVLVSATGAVIGGISAAYTNKKARKAIRIVNSVTMSENMCDNSSLADQQLDVFGDGPQEVKAVTNGTQKATVCHVMLRPPSATPDIKRISRQQVAVQYNATNSSQDTDCTDSDNRSIGGSAVINTASTTDTGNTSHVGMIQANGVNITADVVPTSKAVTKSTDQSTIGNFADEIFEQFSLSS